MSEMKVVLKDTCGRCQRVTSREVGWDEASKIHAEKTEEASARVTVVADIKAALEATPNGAGIVMLFGIRQPDGTYTVTALNDLCTGTADAQRLTGCVSRVNGLLSEIFMTAPKPLKVRKPKEANEAGESTESTEDSGDTNGSANPVADVANSSKKKARK